MSISQRLIIYFPAILPKAIGNSKSNRGILNPNWLSRKRHCGNLTMYWRLMMGLGEPLIPLDFLQAMRRPSHTMSTAVAMFFVSLPTRQMAILCTRGLGMWLRTYPVPSAGSVPSQWTLAGGRPSILIAWRCNPLQHAITCLRQAQAHR